MMIEQTPPSLSIYFKLSPAEAKFLSDLASGVASEPSSPSEATALAKHLESLELMGRNYRVEGATIVDS